MSRARRCTTRSNALVASLLTPVTIDRDCSEVEVVNLTGAAAIYVKVNGSTPTAVGQGTYELPAAVGVLKVVVSTSGDTVVKLISAGAPSYSVTGSTS